MIFVIVSACKGRGVSEKAARACKGRESAYKGREGFSVNEWTIGQGG